MRSLFHFPLPCTTTLAVTVSYSNRPTAPEMSRRPHPAPMRRQRRSPVLLSAARPLPGPALTGPRPTVTRSQGARHAAPPSLPRGAARSHRAPSPEYRPAAACTASPASRPPRAAIRIPLCRHRADPALIAPPSRLSCAAAVLHVLRFAVRIAPTVRRHPRHPPHLSPRVAAAPGPWPARTAPYASLFRRMREKGPLPGNIRPKCMLFEIRMATSSPHASVSGRNRAIRDTWRANLAAKGPFSRRGARNHAWREDVANAARPFRGSGMRSGGTGFAPCGSGMRHAAWPNGLCALRRGPGLLAACAPPAISLVPAAACAPCHLPAFIAAVLHAPCFAVRDPPRGPRTDASRYLRAAPIPPAARTHRVQETSGTTQTTQCGHKNRTPKWGPH